MIQDIVIRGSGGHAQEVAYLIEKINQKKPLWNLLGYIDVKDVGMVKCGYKVIGGDEWFKDKKNFNCIIAIGDPNSKFKVYTELKKYELNFPNIIDPIAKIGRNTKMGIGNLIMGSVGLSTNNKIGNFCLLNGCISVGHDTHLADFVNIMPFSSIAGNVEVGDKVFIGAGATIIQGLKVGRESVVGAGAVVIRNVKDGCTVFGNPAKIVYQK